MFKFSLKLFLGLVFLMAIAPFVGAAHAEGRLALVVGINDYPKLKIPLFKAVADANKMAETLRSLGFNVELSTNADRLTFFTKLEALKRQIKPGDTVFVFYSGHGISLKGSNLLLPSDMPFVDLDSEQLVRSFAIAETEVIEGIRAQSAGLIVVTLDACRDNPLEAIAKQNAKAKGGTFRSLGLTRSVGIDTRPTSGIFSIYSAGIGQKALDGLSTDKTEQNSIFTRVFARKIIDRSNSLSEIMDDVKEEVTKLASSETDPETKLPFRQFPAYYNETQGGRVFLAGRPAQDSQSALPSSAQPSSSDGNAQRDYELADRVGTKDAWDSFISKYPSGFYADLARAQQNKTAAEEARIAATEKAKAAKQEQDRLAAEAASAARLEQARLIAERAAREEQEKAAAQVKASQEARATIPSTATSPVTPVAIPISRTLLSQMGPRSQWAIGSTANCNVARSSYSFELAAGSITWRNGVGSVDIESVTSNNDDSFSTTTRTSIHSDGNNVRTGQVWNYWREGNHIRAQAVGKNAFSVFRCQ